MQYCVSQLLLLKKHMLKAKFPTINYAAFRLLHSAANFITNLIRATSAGQTSALLNQTRIFTVLNGRVMTESEFIKIFALKAGRRWCKSCWCLRGGGSAAGVIGRFANQAAICPTKAGREGGR